MFPALWVRPVHAAVMVVASGPVLHETFKRPMIAIGKIKYMAHLFSAGIKVCGGVIYKCVSP